MEVKKGFTGWLTTIKKRLKTKTAKILSQNTQNNWVYRASIRDAGILFETGKWQFGKYASILFKNEYNQLFNQAEINKEFNTHVDLLRLTNKVTELKAIYYALIYGDGANANKKYLEMFGKKFEGTESDINRINDKAQFYIDKINHLQKVNQKSDKGITFNELIAIVENSRKIVIDRQMKVFEFYKIYELELKKWQTSTK